MSVREVVRDLTPPALLRVGRRLKGGGLRFAGRPADWADACRMSSGYAASAILERVVTATRAVVSGEAAYERDGVLFDEPAYPFAILAALLRAAALDAGRLDVVDFGGSLGSTYHQCRPFLAALPSVHWRVVEQQAFVEAGRSEFSTAELEFFGSVDEMPEGGGGRVILLSSVLQYLPEPARALAELLAASARHVVIDRTPLSRADADRLCIQHVPKHIYEASYPCWILSRSRLLAQLSAAWRVVAEFPCAEGSTRTEDGLPFEFRGLILERRT
jgi:putative methyltransferase (TIGR04325 family)